MTVELNAYGVYTIYEGVSVVGNLTDVIDFNYFNPSFLPNYSDASRSAGMIQCAFGRATTPANVGQVGLVRINFLASIDTYSVIK